MIDFYFCRVKCVLTVDWWVVVLVVITDIAYV